MHLPVQRWFCLSVPPTFLQMGRNDIRKDEVYTGSAGDSNIMG